MTTPTPILDSADARYIELAAFIAMQPDWQGPDIETMTADERAVAHAYLVYGQGVDERDGIDPEVDAMLTTVSVLRLLRGDVPSTESDQTGGEVLARFMDRFHGREHLLFEEAVQYIEFLEARLRLYASSETDLERVMEYYRSRSRELGIDD